MLVRLAPCALLLAASVSAKSLAKLGDGQCNGGVGGVGEYKCLVGGTCNEGGTPSRAPTETGTSCPGQDEYLLCTEAASVDLDTCGDACMADPDCTGFMLSSHQSKGTSRCELHTKLIEFASKPLECYSYIGGLFDSLGKGACRTKEITQEGPQKDTYYGYMEVRWVPGFSECKLSCQNSVAACVGIEFQPTAAASGHKCELHFEELGVEQMSTFQCWEAADVSELSKKGDGQCNGGVGGIGEFKCIDGGTCNEGGDPIKPPTETGTGCPGEKEYLLCEENGEIDLNRCMTRCAVDADCQGFLVTDHAALGTSRCELHTKPVEFAAEALECHEYKDNVMSRMGYGACRTAALTVGGDLNGTRYGYFSVAWVPGFRECELACQNSAKVCFGVEYHPTAVEDGTRKCEVHYEELSKSQMSTMQCWTKNDPTTPAPDAPTPATSPTSPTPGPRGNDTAEGDDEEGGMMTGTTFIIVIVALAAVASCACCACFWKMGGVARLKERMPASVIGHERL